MFGKKRTLSVVLVVLAAGTALAALSTSIGLLIVAHVIQGAGGAIFPVLAATVGTIFFVPESPVRAPGRIDPVRAALLSGWLVALLLPVSEGESWGWTSGRSLGLFALAAALALAWVRAETRSRAPVVDMQMTRQRAVWTTNLAALVFGFGMFSSFVLVPELVELPRSTGFGFGASVTQAGMFMIPATTGMLLAGPVSGRTSRRAGSRSRSRRRRRHSRSGSQSRCWLPAAWRSLATSRWPKPRRRAPEGRLLSTR
jgi:MFS family permease